MILNEQNLLRLKPGVIESRKDWDCSPFIKDMLSYYAEASDVQMVCTVLVVLKDFLANIVPLRDAERCFHNYIGENSEGVVGLFRKDFSNPKLGRLKHIL